MKTYHKIKLFLSIVWRKWEYSKNDPLSFRIPIKTAWEVAGKIWK
jgi:hypothetical protein